MTRSRGRKDNNQDDIVKQCRKFGMIVEIFSQYKGHKFDLLIGYYGIWLPFEVKRKESDSLTENEIKFSELCLNHDLPVCKVINFEQVLNVFKFYKTLDI